MTIRHMRRHQIVTLMKARRVRGLDVAARVGISQSTFVRVIARKEGIAEETKDQVWATLEKMLNAPLKCPVCEQDIPPGVPFCLCGWPGPRAASEKR